VEVIGTSVQLSAHEVTVMTVVHGIVTVETVVIVVYTVGGGWGGGVLLLSHGVVLVGAT
jgi:hypothetical protein